MPQYVSPFSIERQDIDKVSRKLKQKEEGRRKKEEGRRKKEEGKKE
ncbi:MAG: hypothetical protein HC849_16005, partial [Oscillatoriales cyanobacterium RU_3_3]|nr:hypothetical protein [Oscillatoriales cyanobacterium RU_3_3]